jgi:cell division transport system permease protein
MQLRYVFSETGTGLRRNVSMTVALIVTIFVSLTLVGVGLLLNAQAHRAEDYWGSKLQITVFLCNANSRTPHCAGGDATAPQKAAIEQVLKTSPEVKGYQFRDKQEAYDALKKVYESQNATDREIFSSVQVKDMNESYRVTLTDPRKFEGVKSAVGGLDGVNTVQDLHTLLQPIYYWLGAMKWGAIGIAIFLLFAAVLEVGNTIRLAAFARRREIGIMRLVGAGSLYIQLPFLMETLVAALIGIAFSAGAILLFMYVVVYGLLRPNSTIVAWIDWWDALRAIGWITALGVVLTMFPTLVLTRKYLKV